MKKVIVHALTASLLFAITACNTINSTNLMSDIRPSAPHDTVSLDASAEAFDFAAELFKNSVSKDKNTLISPISVLYAISMTANGANDSTLDEIETVVGNDIDSQNSFLRNYMKSVNENRDCKLNLANSIWFTDDERFTVNREFLQTNADFYGADIYRSPFDNTTVSDINTWVKDRTDGMIPNILDDIPTDAIMYLINALAFDAEWQNIYYDHQVRKGTFVNAEGDRLKVPFMHSDEFGYIEDEHASGFIKYYKGREYAFVALLPNEETDIESYINTLSGEHIGSLLENISNEKVITATPKFKFDYSTEMTDVLRTLGINDAFDADRADFSGLGSSNAGNIFISRVIHKTFISVDERGTRAGAATLVETADGAMDVTEEPKRVYLDRPFVFMIIDTDHRLPLFMGTVADIE